MSQEEKHLDLEHCVITSVAEPRRVLSLKTEPLPKPKSYHLTASKLHPDASLRRPYLMKGAGKFQTWSICKDCSRGIPA